jgi:ligand-binding sensor domain-containing protein
LFITVIVSAQFRFEKPVVITKENGLPVNNIRSITKGEDGFVWIATSEGLCRFDGLQMKVFQTGLDLRYSLFDNSVFAMQPLKDKLWIGTSQGLSVMNIKDYSFKHYQLENNGKTDSLKRRFDQIVTAVFKDRSNNIWIGTADRGVAVYEEAKDDFRFYSFPPEKYLQLMPSLGTNNSILSITESVNNDSIIWAGTTAGLQKINRRSGIVELFTFPQQSKDYQVALNVFRRLYHHDDGLLYVGSWAAGVNVFDPVTKTFTPLPVKNETGKRMVKNVIGNISRKNDHEIWISTLSGLAIYDTRLKDITWFRLNNLVKNEFYSISIIDEANRVWHADINGVNYYDPIIQQFSKYSFKHLSKPDWAFAFYIFSDSTGNKITVCPRVTDGLYFFDKTKKEWSKTTFPGNQTFLAEREAVKGFTQIAAGEYLIASDKGVYRFSEKNKKLIRIKNGFPFAPTRRGDILMDRSGNVWLCDNTWGLTKWTPALNKFISYKEQTSPVDTIGPFNRVINLFEDSHGNIWFQRPSGFGVYIASKDTIVSFIYNKNEERSLPTANSFAEDRKGRVWLSSGDGWIGYTLSSDPQKGIIGKLNIRDKGISGNLIRLATDPNGEVWGHNLKELVKINAEDISLSTYSFQYGADEADFFHFSFLPSGEIILGGRNDIVLANPADLKRNTEIPIPYIDHFEVLNQPFGLADHKHIRLKHNQNFFSVGFSAKAFTMAKEVRFRYRLYGFDDWKEVTGRRFANYTNVPGGDYVFQLQAGNNEGLWNDKIIELPIYVATAFWKTWWFRGILLMLIVAAAYSFYRYRMSQVKKKQKLKSEYEKKLANVEMSALLAQMNPHFLFNSLNSIDSYIIRNESKKASEYLNNFARLMRLILQNSRSNYISLKDELEALDLYLQMESLRFKNKFNYSINVDETTDTNSIVIPPMLIQPYVENAIWHGLMHKTNGEVGKVELQVSKKDDTLFCVIVDNGIGRKKAAELRAQKNSNHKRSMGMQITKDRIEIINKLYNINASVNIYDLENINGEAQGTKVELTIPI